MSILLLLGSIVLYLVAYFTYGRYLARKIFKLSPESITPANSMRDDKDYLPTKKHILFGHHYTSIAGTGPIVGPAIGIIWGWVPALIWILVGSIFMGAVHDFGSLVVSARHRGQSIGDVAGELMGNKVYFLFITLIFICLWILLAVFGLVVANIFSMFPQSVFPVWMEIPIALLLGYMIYSKKANLILWSIIAVILTYITVTIGAYFPLEMPTIFGLQPNVVWLILLFIYAFIASILPIGTLLQPRDYINGHQLMIAMGLLVVGVLVARPELVAPALNSSPEGAPSIIPYLFLTIACGAISGFHALVGSGTSSKQLNKETDAQFVGYGSMLLEGLLAILVLIAVGAGLGMKYNFIDSDGVQNVLYGSEAFKHHYASWGAAKGLGAKLGAFVHGSANMIETLGIPKTVAIAIMGMFVASFAGTSMDTALRLQRYVVTEIAAHTGFTPMLRVLPATIFAALASLLLAFIPMKDAVTGVVTWGKGGLLLWPLFGASNQLIAALALSVLTIYLMKRKSKWIITAIPMGFMLVITATAMFDNLSVFAKSGRIYLSTIDGLLLILEILFVFYAVRHVIKLKNQKN